MVKMDQSGHKISSHLPDHQQTAWQLAVIQLSGWISLPILATGILVLQRNSFLGAVLTIIVGNAILWFLRIGILSMSYEKRQSTLDLARDYMGNVGGYFIAFLLLASTLVWFIAQTNTGSSSITQLIHIKENPGIDRYIQISVLLGILSTFFCLGGIVLLRKLATYSFPLLVILFFTILYALPERASLGSDQHLSLSGLSWILATNLGNTSDLPTFFRHGKSWETAVKALTITQLISLFLGVAGLYIGQIISAGFEINYSVVSAENLLLISSLTSFVFISVVCANVANVYSASVGWELVAPKALVGRKEYLILGLGITTIFILISNLFSLELLLNVTDSSLVNLCFVFLVGYIIKSRKKRLPDSLDQNFYFCAWMLATILNIFQFSEILLTGISPLFASFVFIVGFIGLVVLGRNAFRRLF